MPKIFISYRRKSWGFTHRLADQLRERLDADVFVDVDSIDQTDFENAIVNHLRNSDVVLLVISETTFADRIHRDDDWVRREIRETLERKIPLALVCVEGLLPPSGLPEDIKDVARMQGINFYPEYFTPGVEKLTDFVAKVSPIHRRTSPLAAPQADPAPAERAISGKATLDEALALMEKDDYDKAVFLLESLRETGYTSRFVKLDEILETARQNAREAERRRAAQIEYDDIVPVVKSRVTRMQGLEAFKQWSAEYPEFVESLDTQKLREMLPQPAPPSTPPERVIRPIMPKRPTPLDLMPKPFAWVEIPSGKVTLKTEKGWAKNYIPEGKSQTFDVPTFIIAKYPTTNAQFAKFMEADGYNQQNWWTPEGWQTKEKEKWSEPRYWQDSRFNPLDHPVVGVSWYEAVAFCLWLSEAAGEKIILPTEQQWQRAAQGDDNRAYPWGENWDCKWCNNRVKPCDSNSTTPVTQYEGKGDSPFKVVDMSGNVWEWCLTAYESGSVDINRTDARVLRGGSWRINLSDSFRADYRYGFIPLNWNNVGGFRLARS